MEIVIVFYNITKYDGDKKYSNIVSIRAISMDSCLDNFPNAVLRMNQKIYYDEDTLLMLTELG